METVSNPIKATAVKTEVFPAELIPAFNEYTGIKLLSLDCFDTLLWRKTATPIDVFYELQHHPAFKNVGFSASMRIAAEVKARKLRFVKEGMQEVNLHDIYRAHHPTLDDSTLNELTAAELSAELTACYAFPPVVELIRAASAKNIKVIIVSDTYLKEKQLRELLAAHLPVDVMTAIYKIFCSCEHGKSKREGIFKKILNKMHLPAKSVLHIGDSLNNDFHPAKREHMNALRLLQNDTPIEQLLRLQTLAASYIDGQIRYQRPMPSPFHGALALGNLVGATPESLLGYAVLGPLLYAFAKFILARAEELRSQGKNLKLLFLLRDGYLPALVCDLLAKQNIGKQVRISRFVALAASFRTQQDVDSYLCDVVQTLRFHDIARQLLLPEDLANQIIAAAERMGNLSGVEFIRQVQQKSVLQTIFQQSSAYRERLKKHLINTGQIERGDTVMFVDLGYTGTAQILLTPVLREEMAVEINGCYLLSMRTPNWESSRTGLLDPSWCDDRTLSTLVNYVALLEQVCTSNDKSAVDFDEMGEPIFSAAGMKQQQHQKITRLQEECLRFAKEAELFFSATKVHFSLQELRDISLAHLSRLIFLPTQAELEYLESVEFDLNLGTSDILKVFDQEAGMLGLRRRGLFFMERNAKNMRTNYPAELRAAGVELSLLLMAQHRFGLEIRRNEFSLRRETLPVIIMRDQSLSKSELVAMPTYDGFFTLIVPLGKGGFQVGVQLGSLYEWVQLESIEMIKAKALFMQNESTHTEDIFDKIVFDQMAAKKGRVFECLTPSALFMFMNPPITDSFQYVLRLVFRPLVKR